jgi:hypothetical protein
MANVNAPGQYSESMGDGPFIFDLPVDGGSKIYRTTLVAQLTATGQAVPYSTASSGICVGVAQHDIDNTSGNDGDKRVRVETKRAYAFTNGTAGDAFADTTLIGSLVYGTDDHTVAKTSNSQARKPVGFFLGLESDGKVRVWIDPVLARIVELLQLLTDAPATADALRDNIVTSFG